MLRKPWAILGLVAAGAWGQANPAIPPSPDALLAPFRAWAADGHDFTAEERAQLAALEPQLAVDPDALAEARLLGWALDLKSRTAETAEEDQTGLAAVQQAWAAHDRASATRPAARLTRDLSLWTFSLAVAGLVGTSTSYLRLEQTFTNDSNPVRQGLILGFFGSGAVALASLFPLLWGEVNL